jgi:hypothetical protein
MPAFLTGLPNQRHQLPFQGMSTAHNTGRAQRERRIKGLKITISSPRCPQNAVDFRYMLRIPRDWRSADGSGNRRVFFAGMLGGVFDPGGDTMLDAFTFGFVDLAFGPIVDLAASGSESRLLSLIVELSRWEDAPIQPNK